MVSYSTFSLSPSKKKNTAFPTAHARVRSDMFAYLGFQSWLGLSDVEFYSTLLFRDIWVQILVYSKYIIPWLFLTIYFLFPNIGKLYFESDKRQLFDLEFAIEHSTWEVNINKESTSMNVRVNLAIPLYGIICCVLLLLCSIDIVCYWRSEAHTLRFGVRASARCLLRVFVHVTVLRIPLWPS